MTTVITTTYMGLELPIVESSLGPQWAALINAALEAIDTHDHSTNRGVPVTPAGLDLNSLVDFQDNIADAVNRLRLTNNPAILTGSLDVDTLYTAHGDLFFNDVSGNTIQLTANAKPNVVVSGSILAKTLPSNPYAIPTTDTQRVLLVDSTAVTSSLFLPLATTLMSVFVKDVGGNADLNPIYIIPSGSNTVEGLNATHSLNADYGSWMLVSDGTSAWWVC